jgi:hypothetical protein
VALDGIHHITCIAADAGVDFDAAGGVLGGPA